MSESGGPRQHTQTRIDRQRSCPEPPHSYCESTTSSKGCQRLDGGKGAGKRFARRAKRWAELQQRRQNARTQRSDCEGGARYYDLVELARMGSGVLEDSGCDSALLAKAGLGPRRSLPYSLLQPRQHEVPMFYPPCDSSQPLYVTQGLNEYGHATYISVYQTAPELTVYPVCKPSTVYRNSHNSEDLSMEDSDDLSLLAADLSSTCISSDTGSSSPLSTSISSQASESDDVFVYPPLSASLKNTSKRCRHQSYPQNNAHQRTFYNSHIYQEPSVHTVPPPDRSWVMIRHADPDRPIATFTVLCYNVLCDKYATAAQYSYCPSWALNWEYRKTAILKEIRNYEADIVTLQEVETEQYRLLFQPEMKALGYCSIFSPKSRAKTMNEEDRKYVDGCAIFWKSDKFEIDHEQLIEFTQVAIQKAQHSDHMLNRVMPKDNIALCAVLRVKDNVYNNRRVSLNANDNVVGSPLVVCTAHIHWDPEFCDVKLVQCMMLASELQKLLNEVADKFRIAAHQTPVLICGDLNSLPDSGVFEFLSKGCIPRQHADLKNFKDDPTLDRFSTASDRGHFSHSLRLDSAVDNMSVPFTNYTLDFKGVIDYIFSTPQSLARLGVLGPFDMQWVLQNKIIGFPHPHVPSDHIPIMAQYAIIPTSHQRPPPPPGQPGAGQGQGSGQHPPGTHGSHGFGQLGSYR